MGSSAERTGEIFFRISKKKVQIVDAVKRAPDMWGEKWGENWGEKRVRFIPFSFPRENISRIFHLTFHFTFHLNVHVAFSPHFSTENPAFVFENSRRIHCAVPPRVAPFWPLEDAWEAYTTENSDTLQKPSYRKH